MKFRFFFFLVIIIGAVFVYQYSIYNEYSNRPLPTNLHPIVKKKAETLQNEAEKIGIPIIITDAFRSFEEQDAIYARGRTTDGSVVTYAKGGDSYHNYGLAIDFALLPSPERAIWDLEYDGNQNGKSDWMEVVHLAKNLGFSWGGDFANFKDYPHLQMDFGLSIRELRKGKRPEDVIE